MTAADARARQAVAHLRFARTAPRKLRRVADAIRGKSVREALVLLKFADVFAAEPIEKLVRSAVANAGNNHDMNADDLYITPHYGRRRSGRTLHQAPGSARARPRVLQAQAAVARDGHRQRSTPPPSRRASAPAHRYRLRARRVVPPPRHAEAGARNRAQRAKRGCSSRRRSQGA